MASNPNQAGIFCHNCGNPMAPGTVFCGNCGTPVGNVEEKTTIPFQQQQRASGVSGGSGANYLPGGQQTSGSNINYSAPPVAPNSSTYLPNVPPRGLQTPSPVTSGFYQAPPPPQEPQKSSRTARRLLIIFATCLLLLLIIGGGLFAYAYQLGKGSSQGVATPTATTGIGQTAQTPTTVATQTTPDTSLTTTPDTSATSTPDTSATSTPDTSLTPTATPVSVPSTPGTSLYKANFQSESTQWSASNWSIVDGVLVNNGSGNSFVPAPYQPSTRDYAILVTLSNPAQANCYGAAVVARATSDGTGIAATYNSNELWISTPGGSSNRYTYSAGSNKFTVRLEVKGTNIKLFLNGSKSPIENIDDTSRTDPGQVGMSADSCQLQVFSFEVIAL